jgi:hypothetical protein
MTTPPFSLTETILTIDSSTRDTSVYPDTNEYSIPIGRTVGVCGVDILDAIIPATQDPISARNNALTFSIGNAAPVTVTVPPGTYTEATLVTALDTALTTEGSGLAATLDTHRVTLTHASAEFRVYTNRPSSIHPYLGIITTAPYIDSISRTYTPPGMVDPTGGARYIRVRSNREVKEQAPDHCDPGMGLYTPGRDPPWIRYPTRFYATPSQISSIGVRFENPDGTLYETGCVNHVLLVRLWRARATASSIHSQEYQSR